MYSEARCHCRTIHPIAAKLISFSAIAVAGLCAALMIGGCGTPGAPQPPSLELPEKVSDLTATRAGNSVSLIWTTPRKTTDHLLIKTAVKVTVCRKEGGGSCFSAGEVSVEPGANGEFRETLPTDLATGSPRQLDYFVELKSPKGRSAGLSNAAIVLAGAAPPAIAGLFAEVRADGVALRWTGNTTTLVRLHRKLLTQQTPQAKQTNGILQPPQEPELRDLLVEPPTAGQNIGALDRTARFGEVYEYAAQRVVRVSSAGEDGSKALELDGEISAPIRVEVIDTFPPAVPEGLVAVLVAEEKTIDLSWQPDTDEDLAGYIVYRSETGSDWKRVSGPQPLTGSAFRDTTVESGHSYRYAVSAIDLTGHESKRSIEAQESIPNP